MSRLTAAVQDMLITQYVWTLQNEQKWHADASAAIAHNNPEQFDRVCWAALARAIRSQTVEAITTEWIHWVVGELRRQMLLGMKEVPSKFLKYVQGDIAYHLDNAKNILDKSESDLNQITKKETTMSINTIPFATRHEIFGQDTKDMTEAQLIDAIKKIEAEIGNLGQVKTASKKIDAKKAELTTMLANVVEILDSK